MTSSLNLLVVDDNDDMRVLLRDVLQEAGYGVVTASNGKEAIGSLCAVEIDAVVTDLKMDEMDGQELLSEVLRLGSDIPVILITAFGTIGSAVRLMRAGAFSYLAKPFKMDDLLETVDSALQERQLRREIAGWRTSLRGRTTRLVSQSPAMARVLKVLRRAAAVDSPVLILGESGTGKELLVRTLHAESPRHRGRLVAVNCSAIPETLLESLLFGHRRGAFTDANEDRRGLFLEASGGTILLDEIGDMPLSLQTKLLRVLQEKEVQPLGASAPVRVDARVVAATHRDLESLVAEGRFRQDLYYRLNVIEVRVPPLRDRPEDLLPLIACFLDQYGKDLDRTDVTLSPCAFGALTRHHWPGNVRELENTIARALALTDSRLIRIDDLPDSLRSRSAPITDPSDRRLEEVERDHILRTLRAVKGNKTAAARILGLDRKTLYRKLEAYGMAEA